MTRESFWPDHPCDAESILLIILVMQSHSVNYLLHDLPGVMPETTVLGIAYRWKGGLNYWISFQVETFLSVNVFLIFSPFH